MEKAGLARISGVHRRLVASVALCALASPFLGTVPAMASSSPVLGASFEAVCPAATPGTAECLALRRTDVATPATAGSGVSPQATASAYGPSDLESAYALPTGNEGYGLTVAVVDAYDLPTAEADLAAYRSAYRLPACTTATGCFRKVNQTGGTSSYPAADSGWGSEIALDIDMVSAICPNCKILLVEANTNDNSNLGAAVNTAVALGAMAVSNSYGGPEWSGETTYDALYYNHPGVAVTVATGDCGYHCSGGSGTYYNSVEYPAASQYVIAVGGTSLTPDSSTRGWTETAWGNSYGGAGSGCSAYEPKPSWQRDTGCAHRTEADVSAVADPATGVWVYDAGSWSIYGGTSAASPIIAATFALAGGPAAGTYPASYLYGDSADLNDVVGGNNDVTWHTCTITYLCNGVAGYDGPTGLGTPNGTGAFTAPTAPGKPTSAAATPGNASALVSWFAPSDNGGGAITGYTVTSSPGSKSCTTTGSLSCTVSGLTNGQSYTFTVTATNGAGTGLPSDPSTPVTPIGVPGKPTSAAATAGNGSAQVSWTAPADNGGSAITGYTVASSPDGKTCTTTGATSCTVSSLTNGQTYTFTVTATNGVGTGPASSASNSVTPVGAPTHLVLAPLTATINQGASEAYTATAYDASNDNLGYVTGATTFTISGGGSCDNTAHTCTSTVLGLYTVTGTDGTATGTATLVVQPAPATHLSLSGLPSPYVPGVAHSLTVTALDTYGNTARGYRGTVNFTSSDAAALLPSNYTFSASDAGVHTFSITLNTAGTESVTATDTATATINGAQTGIVVAVYTVSGSFTAGGAPQTGGAVYAFDSSGTYIGSSAVDGSGNYSFTNLLAGTYKFYLSPVTAGFGMQWFGGADFASATAILVSSNTTQNIAL